MSRRFMPAFVRATLIASLSGLMSLASCDLAGSDGGPGSSPGILGSLPPGPLPTPFTLDSVRATIGLAALESNSYSNYPSLSGNGRYVVFSSYADNLVTGDLNQTADIFLRDTQLGVTKMISVSSTGVRADLDSYEPFISEDGRFVVYYTYATNLDELTPDTNSDSDIYLFDRDPDEDTLFFDVVGAGADPDGAPTTTRVSLQDGGSDQAAGGNFRPSISNDGNVVAFLSYSADLLLNGEDSNGQQDSYIRIIDQEITRRTSYEAAPIAGFPNGPDNAADGTNLSGFTFSTVVAGGGAYIVYMTTATDVIYNDFNGFYDVFRVDVSDPGNLVTDRVSLGQGGAIPNSYCYTNYFQGGARAISNDGMLVSFSSSATNIVLPDNNGTYDCFIRDYNAGTVTRVNGPGGVQPNSFTFDGRFTNNGTRVVFVSSASNIGPDGNTIQDIFTKDLPNGNVQLVSQNTNGATSSDYCEVGVISADGTTAAFTTYANNLVDDDNNFQSDIFRRDLTTGFTTRVSIPSGASEANGASSNPYMAGSAPIVVFDSGATNLVEGDTNGLQDVFVRDIVAQTMKLVSVDMNGGPANGQSRRASCSADGRFIAFESTATNLVPNDTNGIQDVFVRDMAAGQTYRVSRDPAGDDANGQSDRPSITADGRCVAFESDASNLIGNDTNGLRDIFVHDRQTGVTTRVSEATGGVEQFTASCLFPFISGDGQFVTFSSDATDLVAGDTNGFSDIFVHDRQTGITTRVSVSSAGVEGDDGSLQSRLSANGRFVVYFSAATNLVGGDNNGTTDIFVRDRQAGITSRVSVSSAGVEGDSFSFSASISADGRLVCFMSNATNLVANDTNGLIDVFVRDRDPNGNGFDGPDGNTFRVSVDSLGTEAAGGQNNDAFISADGRWVGFSSDASNLAFPDVQGQTDIFVRGPLF